MISNNYKNEIRLLAELLNGKEIVFHGDNYEFEEDIPHLIINGKREIVDSVSIQKDTLEMVIQIGNKKEVLNFESSNITTDSIDQLLHDVYYTHSHSWKIGDYENNFLNQQSSL